MISSITAYLCRLSHIAIAVPLPEGSLTSYPRTLILPLPDLARDFDVSGLRTAVTADLGSFRIEADVRDRVEQAVSILGKASGPLDRRRMAQALARLPFIADDIMETFDEPRSEEVFRLLTEIASIGPVIYLTHHRHLCDMAQKVLPSVRIHELTTEIFSFRGRQGSSYQLSP